MEGAGPILRHFSRHFPHSLALICTLYVLGFHAGRPSALFDHPGTGQRQVANPGHLQLKVSQWGNVSAVSQATTSGFCV